MVVRRDELIEGHPEVRLVPQQVHNILGELFCPFYFILSTFFKKTEQNKAHNLYLLLKLNTLPAVCPIGSLGKR